MKNQEKRSVVLFDMDDTSVNFQQPWLDRLFEKTGIRINRGQLKQWDVSLYLPKHLVETLYEIINEPNFFRHLPIREGVVEGINRLVAAGMDVVFLSASSRNAYVDKHDWILEHFPTFTRDNMIFTPRKDLVIGDYLVDDAPQFLEMSPAKTKIVMDAPYNRHLTNYKRAFHFTDAVEQILQMEKAKEKKVS
ncbi:MAG: hypothetical protein ACH0QD_13200 [Tepidibacillus sp.]